MIIELEICEHFNIPKLHSLLHYINCICSLGSADGYNMESPEHLHINFAKEAYRASNKRDYVKQMAIWLQESYLIWVEKQLLSMIQMSKDSMMEEEEDVQVQLINPINVTQCDLNANQCDINITDSHDKNLNKFNNTYSLAKQHPHPNLTIEKLAQKFGATNFLPALLRFLHQNPPGTTITPTHCDHFETYKQVVLSLPSNRYLAECVSVNTSGQALAKAAHFDTAFIVEDLGLYQSEGGISGTFLFFYLSDFTLNLIYFISRSSCCSG